MNITKQDHTNMEKRVNEICRCMFELELLEKARLTIYSFNDKYNNLWGEMDWLDELHRLIHI